MNSSKAFFRHLLAMFLTINISSWAVPKVDTVSLPMPDDISDEDLHLIVAAMNLQVQQDDQDPYHYYFKPPFHVRQYEHGAASMVLNKFFVQQFAKALNELEARKAYAQQYNYDELARLEEKRITRDQEVAEALEKLEQSLDKGSNEEIIAFKKARLETKRKELEKIVKEIEDAQEIISTGVSLLPAGLGRFYFEGAITALATAGINLQVNAGDDPDLVIGAINNALDQFGMTYAGYLSFNAYAGFSQRQLDALKTYKAKFAPHIKISLLPIDGLSFFPLTERTMDDKGKITSGAMFRNAKGAGDYLGASVVLDATILGAMALSENLPSHNLPIGIKAKFTQKYEAAEAILHCDFTSGFSVNGRADIRDGWIIYDNDIVNNISYNDDNHGGCWIEHIRGPQTSSKYKALEELEKYYNDMHMEKTNLSMQEKDQYYNYVMSDLAKNRKSGSDGAIDANGSWWQIAKQSVANIANFHWHTSIHNVKKLSHVKFKRPLIVTGHEGVEREMPVDLCIVYNRATNAYDRCIPKEAAQALAMKQAMELVKSSDICKSLTDPFECGKKRNEAGLNDRTDDITHEEDSLMPNNI